MGRARADGDDDGRHEALLAGERLPIEIDACAEGPRVPPRRRRTGWFAPLPRAALLAMGGVACVLLIASGSTLRAPAVLGHAKDAPSDELEPLPDSATDDTDETEVVADDPDAVDDTWEPAWKPSLPFKPFKKFDASDGGAKHSASKHASTALPSDREYGPPTERPAFLRPLSPDLPPSAPHTVANLSGVCHWNSYRLPRDVLPLAYNLTIELGSLKAGTIVYGQVEIEVTRNLSMPPARCLVLHVANDISIDQLQVCTDDGGCFETTVVAYDADWSQLQLELPTPLAGVGTVMARFSYVLRDKLTGLYHSRFFGTDGAEHSIATTQHEATSARETFPCWDEPGFKATFALALHVPARVGTVALANMPALHAHALHETEGLAQGRPRFATSEDAAPNALAAAAGRQTNATLSSAVAAALAPISRLKRVVFGRSPRMSTYLVAFTVGEFESISATSASGVKLSAWAPAATEQVGKLRFALEVARTALEEYESLFDVPFPLPKIDIVSIPDFGPGAMENWGLITYRATNVLADERSAPHDLQSVACTVVHELGHQWTGNLVTMQWWDELWLNEGFANYFEQAVTDVVQPKLQILRQHVQYLSRALHFDGSPDTHAVRPRFEVDSDSGVSSLFDAISYDKAGAVIYMLHDYLERKVPGAFLDGLKSYLQAHAFGSASGADMWKHISRASGLPIAQLVEPWFAQAGYPLIEVTTLSDGSAVVLQTGRFLQDLTRLQMAFQGRAGAHTEDALLASASSWWVPISYFTSDSDEVQVGEIASTSSFFSIPPTRKHAGGYDIDGTDWLKVNFNGAGYYRVNYAPHLWERLVAAAAEPGRLSDADLSNLIDDAFALTLDGRLSGVTLSLARALGGRTAHEAAFVSSSYESWAAMSAGLHTFLSLISTAALAASSTADGLIAGPGLKLIPRRCVDDMQRFVRTQVLGRCLDALLALPPSGKAADAHGASAGAHADDAAEPTPIGSQLEALAPPVLLSLASTMADVRVGVWVIKALQPCIDAPSERCAQIFEIPPSLRFPCLHICTAFDASGRCWRLMLEQLRYAEEDPAYRSALMVSLARAPTEELLNATIALSVNASVVRPQDCGSMIAMLANNPLVPRARTIVWEFAKAHVLSLSQGGGGGGSFGFSSVLSNVASGFASEEMAQDVQIFLALNPSVTVPERIVRAVVGRIRSQAAWVDSYGADTCDVLSSWHA